MAPTAALKYQPAGLLAVMLVLAPFVADPSSAQSNSRVRDTNVASSGVPTPPSTGVPGTIFSPFVGLEGGYDTNLDQRSHAPRESRYEMVQAGLNGNWKRNSSETYTLYLRGRRYEYNDLDKSARYDLDASFGARFDISDQTALRFGSSYYRDAVSLLSPIDVFGTFAEMVHEADSYRFRINATSRTELSLKHGEQPDPGTAGDVFAVSRTSAFDFTKNGATASLLMFRKSLIAPFVIGNYTNVNYIHQAPGASLDRDANEVWGVAGIRISPTKDFILDVGMRGNHREFEDPGITHYNSSAFDGRITWRPTDTLWIRGIIERQIKEPTTSFGLADDVRSYELVVEKQLDKWFVYVRGFVDRIAPIGEDLKFDKYNWATGVRYDLGNKVELYGDYGGKYVEEHTLIENYERHRFGAGVRMKF